MLYLMFVTAAFKISAQSNPFFKTELVILLLKMPTNMLMPFENFEGIFFNYF